ncbi:hypothetical protein AVEN_101426-1 [Araneus ventricosus]|uniref:Uncharacterized protein n=1 Tax=Araneus ventricosus TaxID=182803 RepID=A0A4Y2CX37_ARAVE|nr:hypothetical protein AVEN_101426-1 [Araneus ventricosus]
MWRLAVRQVPLAQVKGIFVSFVIHSEEGEGLGNGWGCVGTPTVIKQKSPMGRETYTSRPRILHCLNSRVISVGRFRLTKLFIIRAQSNNSNACEIASVVGI